MSAQFIIEYAGSPVEFDLGIHVVQEQFADRFCCEADAWQAVLREGLNPRHCRVVNLYERNTVAASRQSAAK